VTYARVLVEKDPPSPRLGIDEERVLDLVSANLLAAASDAALYEGVAAGGTPKGWTWAHIGRTQQMALVPIELHASFRHLGGISTGGGYRSQRGVPGTAGGPPRIRFSQRLTDDAVIAIEEHLGYPLPAGYRSFMQRTNDGYPDRPVVHPSFGFVLDQPLFGSVREDWHQDLVYTNGLMRDRLTDDFLAIGYVHGGLLAVRVRGEDSGSVWYLDDDDYRDRDDMDPAAICEQLLQRCAGGFVEFWRALRGLPEDLMAQARRRVEDAAVRIVADEEAGSMLPPNRR
jgi:hypothetical protein